MKVLSPAKAAEIIINGMENDSYRVLGRQRCKIYGYYLQAQSCVCGKFIYKKMKAICTAKFEDKRRFGL
jgi:hypothetical protein